MPHQRRIEGLIAEMTLEEKIGQLGAFADALRPFAFEVNPETFARDAEPVSYTHLDVYKRQLHGPPRTSRRRTLQDTSA